MSLFTSQATRRLCPAETSLSVPGGENCVVVKSGVAAVWAEIPIAHKRVQRSASRRIPTGLIVLLDWFPVLDVDLGES